LGVRGCGAVGSPGVWCGWESGGVGRVPHLWCGSSVLM